MSEYIQHSKRLAKLRDRYTHLKLDEDRYVMSSPVSHHGDCQIYRAIQVYGFANCTCGLIHDLTAFPWEMAERLYPKYDEDRSRDDECLEPNPDPDGYPYYKPDCPKLSPEAIDVFMKEAGFNTCSEPDMIDEVELWHAVENVFGVESVKHMKLAYHNFRMSKDVKEY